MILAPSLVLKCVLFETTKKRTAKQSRNLWIFLYGTSRYLCMLFDTTSLKNEYKKKKVYFNHSVMMFFIINPCQTEGLTS